MGMISEAYLCFFSNTSKIFLPVIFIAIILKIDSARICRKPLKYKKIKESEFLHTELRIYCVSTLVITSFYLLFKSFLQASSTICKLNTNNRNRQYKSMTVETSK